MMKSNQLERLTTPYQQKAQATAYQTKLSVTQLITITIKP
jgi:hypothetical protein